VVCFGSAISLRGLRGIARLGLHRDRKKKGDKTDMISGMIMMLLIAVVAVVGFFLYVWLWATKNEA
jgi:hypothetical protein